MTPGQGRTDADGTDFPHIEQVLAPWQLCSASFKDMARVGTYSTLRLVKTQLPKESDVEFGPDSFRPRQTYY